MFSRPLLPIALIVTAGVATATCTSVFKESQRAALRQEPLCSSEADRHLATVVEIAIDPLVTDDQTRSGAPGAAIIITSGQCVLYAKGYGLADLESRTPVSTAATV